MSLDRRLVRGTQTDHVDVMAQRDERADLAGDAAVLRYVMAADHAD
jgi:hypothetical protein